MKVRIPGMAIATVAALCLTGQLAEDASAAAVSAAIRVTAYRGGSTNANNVGFPYIDLQNMAVSADIIDYKITIGDTSYFWDAARINASSQIPEVNLTNVAPGIAIDNLVATDDLIHFTFAPGIFTPGTTLSHRNDIDADSQEGQAEVYTVDQPDFRQVLFDLDGSDDSDNALITLTFSDGQIISQRLPDWSSAQENTNLIGTSTHNFPWTLLDQVQQALEGDLDGDGFVGISDLNLVLGNWNLNVPPADPLADPSGDNFIGIEDLNTVLGNWNAGTPPAGSSVPEPASLVVLGLGAVSILRRW